MWKWQIPQHAFRRSRCPFPQVGEINVYPSKMSGSCIYEFIVRSVRIEFEHPCPCRSYPFSRHGDEMEDESLEPSVGSDAPEGSRESSHHGCEEVLEGVYRQGYTRLMAGVSHTHTILKGMVCVWYVYGMCMVCVWYVYG